MRIYTISAVVLTLLTSCSVELTMPTDAAITCASSKDCPADKTCLARVGRCVAKGSDDQEGPQFTSIELSSPTAQLGELVRLSFTVSEPLLEAPTITIADAPFYIDAEQTASTELRYGYLHLVTAASPQGIHAISASAFDLAGNETATELISLDIDFLPPAIEGFDWVLPAMKTRARTGDQLAVSGRIEPGATLVAASLESAGIPLVADITSQFTVTSDPPNLDIIEATIDLTGLTLTHGESLRIQLNATDAAGNQNPVGSVQTSPLECDLQGPTAATLTYLGDTPAQTRDVTISTSALGANQILLGGDIIGSQQWQAVPFPDTRLITLSDGDGPKNVTASVRDQAFNETVVDPIIIQYVANTDTVGPSLLGASATDARQINVLFDEAIEAAEAEDESNFTVTRLPSGGAPQVLIVSLSPDQQTVTLILDSDLVGQANYRVEVQNQIDLIGHLQEPNPTTHDFLGFGSAPDPSAPDLLAPDSTRHVTNLTPILQWTARTGAAAYDVEVSTAPGGSGLVESDTISDGSTHYEIQTTLNDQTYYWRVRSDVPPQTWAEGSFEVVGDALFVRCQTAGTCSDAAGDHFGNRSKPYQTISEAIVQAGALGIAEVRVVGGEADYVELVTLRPGVDLRGGYRPTNFSQSNPTAYVTVIRAPDVSGSPGAVALAAIGIDLPTTVDGFTIAGSSAPDAYGAFVAGATDALTIENCVLEVANNSEVYVSAPAALYLTGSGLAHLSGPVIRNNQIRAGNRTSQVGSYGETFGVIISNAAPHLDRNTISGASADWQTYALAIRGESGAVLTNNVLYGGTDHDGGTTCTGLSIIGAYGSQHFPVIVNNTIHAGSCWTGAPNANEFAVAHEDSQPIYVNNLFVTSQTSTNGVCMYESGFFFLQAKRLEKNGFIGCGCRYSDRTGTDTNVCYSSPTPTNTGIPTVEHNVATTSAIFAASASQDFRLRSTALVNIRRYGRDTSSGYCETNVRNYTCGNVTQDLPGNARTCSVAPPASGTIPVSTNCYSMGAYNAP